MRFAAFAARATKKPSRACALCAFFLRHIFFVPVKMLRIFPYRAQKKRQLRLEYCAHVVLKNE